MKIMENDPPAMLLAINLTKIESSLEKQMNKPSHMLKMSLLKNFSVTEWDTADLKYRLAAHKE